MNVKSSFATQIFGKDGMPKAFDCGLTSSPDKPLEYITPTGSYKSPTVTLDVSDLDDVVSKIKRIYVWGRIDYEDVFNESHFLTFCDEVLVDGDPKDANCEIHFMGTRHEVSS
ncbi:hypothetical protein [Bradyrhizobium mercantei]|uniref:hypothetical protein n=1 Tax=Bradyrhizobium mercantei TaxID=1904807 RepID=UPI0009789EED|nr:hypothetical protein [Bradyrhizobium mercantei]